MFKCIEIKLIQDSDSGNKTLKQIKAVIESVKLNPMTSRTFKINSSNLKRTAKAIESAFDCTARLGVTGGCYGARDGSSSEGITVWLSLSEVVERCIDGDTEYYNPLAALNEHGELVEGLDGDIFEDTLSSALEIKSDNSYNYSTDFGGPDSEYLCPMVDFDFSVITSKDGGGPCFISVKFHCGGDIRGNYTSKYVWKFELIDNTFNVISFLK
jgi:hypothetical protein